jgi:hypothetical protein
MKAFDFLTAVAELGISNDVYIPFGKNEQIDAAAFGGSLFFGTIPSGSDIVAVYSDSDDGRDLIAKIKDTPVACVHTENQFIFIYEME